MKTAIHSKCAKCGEDIDGDSMMLTTDKKLYHLHCSPYVAAPNHLRCETMSGLNAGCPFCGASETDVEFINSSTWCFQRCKACGATGPRVCAGHGGDSLEAWNRRALPNNQLAEPVAERAESAINEIMDARQKRAEALHDMILEAREIIRAKLNPETPPDEREVFNKLQAALYTLRGDPFDMHMRAALAALPSPAAISGDGSGAVADPFEHCALEAEGHAELIEQMRGVYPGDPYGALGRDAQKLRKLAKSIRSLRLAALATAPEGTEKKP